KAFKPIPDTVTVAWVESFGATGATRYCPAGYAAMSSNAIEIPSGEFSCETQVFNNSATGQSGSAFAGCGQGVISDYGYYHQVVCSKFY
ncbi:hypothetical protein, partial [Trinickia mobilis]|uniref:hypothetical protein n=1 Tax=Trinickia mobilis TaxID=2816356 RepID=UPI001A8F5037